MSDLLESMASANASPSKGDAVLSCLLARMGDMRPPPSPARGGKGRGRKAEPKVEGPPKKRGRGAKAAEIRKQPAEVEAEFEGQPVEMVAQSEPQHVEQNAEESSSVAEPLAQLEGQLETVDVISDTDAEAEATTAQPASPARGLPAAPQARAAVFASTGLELGLVERRVISTLGASFVSEWSPAVTHLLADTFRRTTKMMCAICQGAHVVLPSFLEASAAAGAFTDEGDFKLQDEVCERAFARKHHLAGGRYSLEEAVERARRNGPMLQGISVYCFPSVTEKHDLPLLVAAAGGKWLQRFPPAPDSEAVLLLAERGASGKLEGERRKAHKVYDVELLREAACTQVLRHNAWKLT